MSYPHLDPLKLPALWGTSCTPVMVFPGMWCRISGLWPPRQGPRGQGHPSTTTDPPSLASAPPFQPEGQGLALWFWSGFCEIPGPTHRPEGCQGVGARHGALPVALPASPGAALLLAAAHSHPGIDFPQETSAFGLLKTLHPAFLSPRGPDIRPCSLFRQSPVC